MVLAHLESLFVEHGAPLVIKADNHGAFTSLRERLLERWGVTLLLSPPYLPQYNGAIEAGNGAMKTRTHDHAALAGRPGRWRSEDLQAALAVANFCSPRAPRSVTVSDDLRAAFRDTVVQKYVEALAEEGYGDAMPSALYEERRIFRKAVRRTLVAYGILHFRRRRVPLPKRLLRAARIS